MPDTVSFPRTRGDVPLAAPPGDARAALPPHARGCTCRTPPPIPRTRASPARAGMYPPCGRKPRRARGFPRTRGDVPVAAGTRGGESRLPPHARGCTPASVHSSNPTVASPARAGMYQNAVALYQVHPGFPRTRGDVPFTWPGQTTPAWLPPHARGCTPAYPAPRAPRTASPARAGMYLPGLPEAGRGRSFPRTRGDVPSTRRARNSAIRLPPHARGCTRDMSALRWRARASPARAGMYLFTRRSARCRRRFPRTRGDVPRTLGPRGMSARLPPHARGCTDDDLPPGQAARASPARAGMYLTRRRGWRSWSGFPRTRGDVPRCAAPEAREPKLPPHARGCTASEDAADRPRQASPARAGMYLRVPTPA